MFRLLLLCGSSILANANPPAPHNDKEYDVAILGGGCAGLSAAMVTGEYALKTILFTGPDPGGALNVKTTVGNWPGKSISQGKEIIKELQAQAKRGSVVFHSSTIAACDFSKSPFELMTEQGEVFKAKTVLIATGTREKSPDSIPGFAKYLHRGIWTNEQVYENINEYQGLKSVLVMGGGVDAMKKGAYASQGKARSVWIAVRGNKMNISPMREQMMKLFKPITILENSEVVSFEGDGEKLKEVVLKTPSGMQRKEVDAVVVSIGREPNSELFRDWLKLDNEGRICIKNNQQSTDIPGIFAAGDVTVQVQQGGQGAMAAGAGMAAGYEIVKYLQKAIPLSEERRRVLQQFP